MGRLETRLGEPAICRPEQTDKEQHEAEDEDRDFHASPSSERDGRLMTFGLVESTRAPIRTIYRLFYSATHISDAAWVAWARRSRSASRASLAPAKRTAFSRSWRCSKATASRSAG